MRLLRIPWRTALIMLHLLAGVLLVPLASRRHSGSHRQADWRIARWWHQRLLRILNLRTEVHGEPPAPPALVVANHVSWLDITVLGCLLPTVFLSKAEVRRWPLIGWLAMHAGTLFIRRGSGQAAQIRAAIAEYLRHGGMLTLFPEGTTSDGRSAGPFFSRLFAAAIEAGVPVAPVALRYRVDGHHDPLAPYTGDQTLLANLLGLLGRHGSTVEVYFLPLLASTDTDSKTLATRARETIVSVVEDHA